MWAWRAMDQESLPNIAEHICQQSSTMTYICSASGQPVRVFRTARCSQCADAKTLNCTLSVEQLMERYQEANSNMRGEVGHAWRNPWPAGSTMSADYVCIDSTMLAAPLVLPRVFACMLWGRAGQALPD